MDMYQKLRNDGKLHGTLRRAQLLASERRSRQFRADPLPRTVAARTVAIPLGLLESETVERTARAQRPRVRNWEIPRAVTFGSGVSVTEEDTGAYSAACTWHRVTYIPIVRSCGVCTAGRLLVFFGLERREIAAPRGWRFGRDQYGLYIVRARETRETRRYHFTADDLRGRRTLASAARAHERLQIATERAIRVRAREQKAESKARQHAERVGVYVGFSDARRAGLCSGGTMTWGSRHGLSRDRRYPLDLIRRLGGGSPQVERACTAAIDRAVGELRAGFCRV